MELYCHKLALRLRVCHCVVSLYHDLINDNYYKMS